MQEEGLRINGRDPPQDEQPIRPVCYFFSSNGLAGLMRALIFMLLTKRREGTIKLEYVECVATTMELHPVPL